MNVTERSQVYVKALPHRARNSCASWRGFQLLCATFAVVGAAGATTFPGTYCDTAGNPCADEGQAYLSAFRRADDYRRYVEQEAERYGYSTKYKVCGPYYGDIGGYPNNYEPAVIFTVQVDTKACDSPDGPIYKTYNYYGVADTCANRPPVSSGSIPPDGATDCQKGCLYRSSSGVLAPTGDVCNSDPPTPEKGNECDV